MSHDHTTPHRSVRRHQPVRAVRAERVPVRLVHASRRLLRAEHDDVRVHAVRDDPELHDAAQLRAQRLVRVHDVQRRLRARHERHDRQHDVPRYLLTIYIQAHHSSLPPFFVLFFFFFFEI